MRRSIFGPESQFERYLGYYVASFSVDDYPRRDTSAYVSYAVPGCQVSRYALRGNRTVFFFVFSRSDRLPIGFGELTRQKEVLREEFGGAGWECSEILAVLDTCSDLYFDAVSQIRMDSWSRGRVALVGDACFCPWLLAGQGSALAMTGAYVLAGELKKAGGDYRMAFRRYEELLRPFVLRKQVAAEKFAGSFAPRTKFGIFLRNQVTRLMSVPQVARMARASLLADPLDLPVYS